MKKVQRRLAMVLMTLGFMKIGSLKKIAAVAIFMLAAVSAASAATFTVNTTADNGTGGCTAQECTLREAIAAANSQAGADIIEFDVTVFAGTQTITLTQGQLSVSSNGALTINGTGASRLSISGNNASRVLSVVGTGANLTLNGVTVTGGHVTGTNIAGNIAGGIHNQGTLTLNNSTVSGNTVSGPFNNTGGGLYNIGTTNLINSSVSGNSVTTSGSSPTNGGGMLNNNGGTINLINSTVSGNSALLGGGIYNNRGTINLTNSTVTNNSAPNGGGISVVNGFTNTVNARNTIISGNTPNNFLGSLSAASENNLVGGNALLAPLADNGGPTETHALLSGSPAINAGNDCVLTQTCSTFNAPSALIRDQRGASRAGVVDIGAYEAQPDTDGDGSKDFPDNCPNTANPDQSDTEGDGIGDACDAFPLDSTESVDTDNDGIGNNADTDDDGDGVWDTDETVCGSDPLNASSKPADNDADNSPDCVDPDDDNDGDADTADNCPVNANDNQSNNDGDAQGDACDSDDDNDGVADTNDAFPFNPSESVDTDGDGTGNNADTDDDNDGVADAQDAFPLDRNESVDTDGDGIGNNADPDDDNDGVPDGTVLYNFAGFFQPVNNLPALNVVNAGQAVPLKFSLGGYYGLGIFAAGYPASGPIACDANEPGNVIAETLSAGGSSLSYDAASGQYSYVWKTDKSWKGTCRILVVKINDGTQHYAKFRFK
jgi:CSLREA domain-containing protein